MSYRSYQKPKRNPRTVKYTEKKETKPIRYVEKCIQAQVTVQAQTVQDSKIPVRQLSDKQKQLIPLRFQMSRSNSKIFPQVILFDQSQESQNSQNSFSKSSNTNEQSENSQDSIDDSSYRWVLDILSDQ